MKIVLKKTIVIIACCMMSTIILAEEKHIKLMFIGNAQGIYYKGALQGLEEANLQGQFLEQSYEMTTLTADEYSASATTGAQAIIVAADRSTLLKISRENPGVSIFNINLSDDDLRYQCLANVLHVIPSDKMLADAKAQWNKKHPGNTATAQAWHPDFVKFAGRDLNKRFLKTHGLKMDSGAWAGWAAVKMFTDTVAREDLTDPAKLLSQLKSNLTFDGQKGISMDFRPTGQLRQPVLLVENDEIVGEAPVRGVAKPPTVDSLGILDCQK